MSYTVAHIPMTPNKVYLPNVVPMYRMPYLSDGVYALLKDDTVVIAGFNHFASKWIVLETYEDISDKIVHWWGPVV